MWQVYKRTNRLNGRFYIGVTESDPEARWEYDIRNAEDLSSKIGKLTAKMALSKPGGQQHKKYQSKINHLMQSLACDIMTMGDGDDVWEHRVLERHENIVVAFLAERELIRSNCTGSNSYNASEGGELPKWVNVVDILNAVKNLTHDERKRFGL